MEIDRIDPLQHTILFSISKSYYAGLYLYQHRIGSLPESEPSALSHLSPAPAGRKAECASSGIRSEVIAVRESCTARKYSAVIQVL